MGSLFQTPCLTNKSHLSSGNWTWLPEAEHPTCGIIISWVIFQCQVKHVGEIPLKSQNQIIKTHTFHLNPLSSHPGKSHGTLKSPVSPELTWKIPWRSSGVPPLPVTSWVISSSCRWICCPELCSRDTPQRMRLRSPTFLGRGRWTGTPPVI